ncbi:MAG: TatD family hydrolase, partial [Endozoicomonas sp.]
MDLFDSHCHLNARAFANDRADILAKCHQLGLSGLCIPSTTASEWESLLSQARGSSQQRNAHKVRQYVALGLHPCFLSPPYQEIGQKEKRCHELEKLDQLIGQKSTELVALGET